MTQDELQDEPLWRLAALVLAVDPHGLGGARVSGAGPQAQEAWLALLRAALPQASAWRRCPINIGDDRLLGGLDLASSLTCGRPVFARGLLAEVDGGILVVPMAERVLPGRWARIAAALDRGVVAVERDGFTSQCPARFGLIALDEGGDDECVSEVIGERLALSVDLRGERLEAGAIDASLAAAVAAARLVLPSCVLDEALLQSVCATACACGIASLRAQGFCVRVARVVAALRGASVVEENDVVLAARLVLGPRALAPAEREQAQAEQSPDGAPSEPQQEGAAAPEDGAAKPDEAKPRDADARSAHDTTDMMIAATAAAIPPDLLAGAKRRAPGAPGGAGRRGAESLNASHGRAATPRRAQPSSQQRLDLLATLRAAAPWQMVRRRERAAHSHGAPARVVELRRDDLHVQRKVQRSPTTTLFVVDASGSAALHRLAEAKGAVELLLAECYVRRDQVALMSFRQDRADLVLPPTRSLVRAKRCLAGVAGGGASPLSLAFETANGLALAWQQRGETPLVVILSDGRANICRDGSVGRAKAHDEALTAARRLAHARVPTVFIDTSRQPTDLAQELAAGMNARYVGLPYANAHRLCAAVQTLLH